MKRLLQNYVPGAVITCMLYERGCYLIKKYENCYLLEMYLRKLNMSSILFFDNNKLTMKIQRYTLNVTLIFEERDSTAQKIQGKLQRLERRIFIWNLVGEVASQRKGLLSKR
jgi:hypothetical protein